MTLASLTADIPLFYRTPDRWADFPLSQPLALLNDHAYLERKAASNALELINRWPNSSPPKNWTVTLSSIARDESLHLNQVTRLLLQRGGSLERTHKSLYASDLRKLVRLGQGSHDILDRLLVCALIEARSCERFQILARNSSDKELSSFYQGLCTSEMGHYVVFLQLAHDVLPAQEVKSRWNEMREAEAKIIAAQPLGPQLHSGV